MNAVQPRQLHADVRSHVYLQHETGHKCSASAWLTATMVSDCCTAIPRAVLVHVLTLNCFIALDSISTAKGPSLYRGISPTASQQDWTVVLRQAFIKQLQKKHH